MPKQKQIFLPQQTLLIAASTKKRFVATFLLLSINIFLFVSILSVKSIINLSNIKKNVSQNASSTYLRVKTNISSFIQIAQSLKPEWTEYKNDYLSISYPKKWKLDDSANTFGPLKSFSINSSEDKEGYVNRAYIWVYVYKTGEYTNSLDKIKTILEKDRGSNNGTETTPLLSESTIDGHHAIVEEIVNSNVTSYKRVFVIKDNLLYAFFLYTETKSTDMQPLVKSRYTAIFSHVLSNTKLTGAYQSQTPESSLPPASFISQSLTTIPSGLANNILKSLTDSYKQKAVSYDVSIINNVDNWYFGDTTFNSIGSDENQILYRALLTNINTNLLASDLGNISGTIYDVHKFFLAKKSDNNWQTAIESTPFFIEMLNSAPNKLIDNVWVESHLRLDRATKKGDTGDISSTFYLQSQPLSKFAQQLKESCTPPTTNSPGKIPFDKLPITLSSKLIERFQINNDTTCEVPYVARTYVARKKDSDWDKLDWVIINDWNKSALLFFISDAKKYETLAVGTDNASIMEWKNHFDIFNERIKPTFNIEGVNVHISVEGGEPNGFSSLGFPVTITGYKQSGDIKIVSRIIIHVNPDDNPQELELIKKYADEKNDDPQTIYANQRSAELVQEFMNSYILTYPNMNSEYKDAIDQVVKNVNGVSFP